MRVRVRGVSGCVAWEHYVIFCSLLASIGIRQDCICGFVPGDLFLFFNLNFFLLLFLL